MSHYPKTDGCCLYAEWGYTGWMGTVCVQSEVTQDRWVLSVCRVMSHRMDGCYLCAEWDHTALFYEEEARNT